MPAARPPSLKVRALQWLAQREHSRAELRDKLLRLLQRSARVAPAQDADTQTDSAHADHGADPSAEIDTLLQWLQDNGHLSDARFVETRVHARQARFGNRRIQQELQQHGVVLDAAARQLLQQSELARAAEVWRRKYAAPADDAAGRARQMRFMLGRGFSVDVVRRVLQGGTAVDDGEGGRTGRGTSR
jgi:regulatory protein